MGHGNRVLAGGALYWHSSWEGVIFFTVTVSRLLLLVIAVMSNAQAVVWCWRCRLGRGGGVVTHLGQLPLVGRKRKRNDSSG